jgi:signal transduction histidine kinase
MYRVIACVTDQHDLLLVVVAALVCALSWAGALFVLDRVAIDGRRHHHAWLLLASATAGLGTWATHFIAMLAFSPGMPVGFSLGPIVLSALIGVGGAWAAFEAHRTLRGPRGPVIAGSALAMGIVGLHFAGMSGVRAPAQQLWAMDLVVAGLMAVAAFAIVGFVALSRGGARNTLAACGLFVGGVVSLHFIGMGALTLMPNPLIAPPADVLDRAGLAIMVTFGVAVLVLLTAMAALADRRIVEERLLRAEEADRSKSRFIANMSHELRTPLNSIIGYSELIAESSAEDMTVADAERVHASAAHLLALVNDLLDLAKIEANHLILRSAPCDLSQLVCEARTAVESAAMARRNRLSVRMEGDLPAVHGDALRIKQCLLNVLSNAIKFTEDGEVVIEARRDGQTVILQVADSGIGMTPEQMRRIFKPFVQGDASIARTHGGTGLGLSITKHLMEMMNGSIDAGSAPGRGATFTLAFPVAIEADAALHQTAAA